MDLRSPGGLRKDHQNGHARVPAEFLRFVRRRPRPRQLPDERHGPPCGRPGPGRAYPAPRTDRGGYLRPSPQLLLFPPIAADHLPSSIISPSPASEIWTEFAAALNLVD